MDETATYQVEKVSETEIAIRHYTDGSEEPATLSLTIAQAAELGQHLDRLAGEGATIGAKVTVSPESV
jgi:hypothetical protein